MEGLSAFQSGKRAFNETGDPRLALRYKGRYGKTAVYSDGRRPHLVWPLLPCVISVNSAGSNAEKAQRSQSEVAVPGEVSLPIPEGIHHGGLEFPVAVDRRS
jgi:hypothetical protein